MKGPGATALAMVTPRDCFNTASVRLIDYEVKVRQTCKIEKFLTVPRPYTHGRASVEMRITYPASVESPQTVPADFFPINRAFESRQATLSMRSAHAIAVMIDIAFFAVLSGRMKMNPSAAVSGVVARTTHFAVMSV